MTVIFPLLMSMRYEIWHLAIECKCGIKCAGYEEIYRLLFSDHKTTSLASNRRVKSVTLPYIRSETTKRGESGASVVVSFSSSLEIMTRVLLPKGTPRGQQLFHRVHQGYMRKITTPCRGHIQSGVILLDSQLIRSYFAIQRLQSP